MITRVKAKNYRCFTELDFKPNSKTNILVGDNEAGKSTLLEIISLLITGRVRGRWASEDLNPYWFNQAIVEQFFEDLQHGKKPNLPTIELEVYFRGGTPGTERLRAIHNSLNNDCPGLRLQIYPDPEYTDEIAAYFEQDSLPALIPTDLYAVRWSSFAGDTITRQPRGLGISIVDNQGSNFSGVDYKMRQLLRDFVTQQESAKIGAEHRKSKEDLTKGVLAEANRRIAEEENSFGISLQMDQSANAHWNSAVSPHIDQTPFSMLGQGRQVETKIALSMSRGTEHTQFVLVEEPENHLSHTQMLKVLNHIKNLAGDRQIFITTHSSFVLNRLGFDSLHLMHDAAVIPLESGAISDDTIRYFQKQSGYDTLRLAIATKVVVVEGPSDEMLFNLAYSQIKTSEPRDDGIDVLVMGTRGKRALELAKALNKKIAVLRDNDGKHPNHWITRAGDLVAPGKRELFVGAYENGPTLEPQIAGAGDDNPEILRGVLGLEQDDSVVEFMLANKVEAAWTISEASPSLTWPTYFTEAIEFVYGE